MKINSLNLAGGFRPHAAACALFWLGGVALHPAFAASDQEAHVTRIIKDVNVLGANKAARPAVLNDHVGPGTGVRTGADSRAELTFSDLSITRLGENTVFSFNGAGRTVQLGSGAVLVEAPPNSAAIHVNTAAFSAAVSGGTALIEFHLGGISKILILEGQGDIAPNGGLVFILPAGEMVTMTPDGKFSEPQKVDLQKIMSTSHLITEFGTLPNEDLIYQVIQQQGAGGSNPNSQPPHDTSLDDTVGRDDANPPGGSPSSGGGGGGGGGSIPVITSPDPYVIGSGTTITTDPTITTGAQTNQGALYHGSAVDGPLSAFLFGSTSGFDAVSGFDAQVQGTMEAAAFKFSDLQLTGNPTIDTTNGPISLGLIALGNITTGTPGGVINFSGLRGVLLAAQNGSVTLGPEVSFSIDHDFNAYARGDSGDLTLGANVTAGGHIDLFAQRDMSITSTISADQFYSFTGRNMTITGTDTIQAATITISSLGNISWDGETSDATPTSSDGSVTIQAVGDLNVANDLSFTRHSIGSDGLNLTVVGGGAVTIQGNLSLVVDNSSGSGSIGTGGNIDLEAGGNLTVNGSNGITLNVLNNNGGDIMDGGNISVSVGGDVTAPALSAVINNQDGGHFHGNASIAVAITGNAGFSAGGLFDIENNSFNTLQGGTLDGNAAIDFSAANVSSGTGSLNFTIHNQANGDGAGGQIGGDATITIQSANLASASTDRGDIDAEVDNDSASITRNAAINLTATGAVGSTFAGNVSFIISNTEFGEIGGNASITAQMASLGAGNELTFEIANHVGFINGGASVDVTVTGTGGVNLPNQATFEIDNEGFGTDIQPREVPTGINGDASVTLNVQHGGLMDDDGLEVSIDNTDNAIGGDATVSATVANAVQINAGAANFEIFNNAGFIGGSASVTANAGSITASNVLAQIDNTEGTITGGANISMTVSGDVTTPKGGSGVLVQLLNEGGQIGGSVGDGLVLTIGGTTTTQALQLYVDNSFNGFIDKGGNLSLTTGPVVMDGPMGAEIDNYNGGTINNGGNVTVHFGGDATDTTGSMHSFNFFVLNGGDSGVLIGPQPGGTIGTGGNITLTFDGNLATTPTMTTGSFGIEIANDTGSITDGGNIMVTSAGDVTARIVSALISNQNGTITNGANITFNTTGTITSTDFTNFEVINIGGMIGNVPEINVHAGAFSVGGALVADYDNEGGGQIGPGGTGAGLVSIISDGDVTVTDGLWVLGSISSGGTISANQIAATGATATTAIKAGSGGITQFQYVDGNNTIPLVTHTLTAPSITSTGGINFNGPDSDGTVPGQDGGTLILNPSAISFDPAGDIQGSVTLDGGAASGTEPPGSGGSLTVNASGDVTVNSNIEATSGLQDSTEPPRGNGGSVSLNSTSGSVTVSSTIQVSSDDPTPSQTPPPPIRRSNSGGNITLTSGKPSGTAIQVTSTAQLLSLLDSAATGPGGVITVKATGASSAVSVSGTVTADKGTIDIEQTGTNGSVTLGDPPSLMGPIGPDGFVPPALTMSADIIKAGALGDNGVLTVGNANLNANTLIALYGGASNGTVDFVANVTLSGATTKIIAANTVTIENGVTVTILGAAADVYANNAHYDSAHGGDGTGGAFDGSVNTHLNQAPPPFGQTSNIAQNNSPSSPNNRPGSTNSRTTITASTSSAQSNRNAPLAQPGRPTFLH